jgi:ribonuclease BN (tRNA processing enzyme)
LDFGSGAFARMREALEPSELDAIVISHMHADHFFDLVPLRYALRYEMQREQPLPVYLPPGGIRVVGTVARPLKESGDFYDGILDLREYRPDRELTIGTCMVRFAPTVQYIPGYAVRAEVDGGVLGFSADTAPCEAVADLVRGADVFLCEAALGADGTENGERGQMNAG